MKFVNEGFLFLVFFISFNLKQVISQEYRARKGNYVAGRNNLPIYTDGEISKIEKVKIEERERFQTLQNEVEKGTTYKDYLFTVQGVEEFMINLPVTQQVGFSMLSYHILDGAYIIPNNIDNESPIKVDVYENNDRLIHRSDFYFQNFVLFNGQEHSTYIIRFENSGSEKLITMSLKDLTETTHINELIDKNIAENHAFKAKELLEDIKFLFNAFERYTMINFQSVKTLLKGINFYYYWLMVETLFAMFVCIVQIISIGKMCKSSPII